jgi:hypothetical protein
MEIGRPRIIHFSLVIIRPLGYRLTKSSKKNIQRSWHTLSVQTIILDIQNTPAGLFVALGNRGQHSRDEKSILGCGQAQVRNPESVELVPAFITADVFIAPHCSPYKSLKQSKDHTLLPRPKWYPKKGKTTAFYQEI